MSVTLRIGPSQSWEAELNAAFLSEWHGPKCQSCAHYLPRLHCQDGASRKALEYTCKVRVSIAILPASINTCSSKMNLKLAPTMEVSSSSQTHRHNSLCLCLIFFPLSIQYMFPLLQHCSILEETILWKEHLAVLSYTL